MNCSRRSQQRDAILSLLRATDTHPSAEWLYINLKETYPNIGLATVYRNLRLFCKQGLVQKIDVGDGIEHFDADISQHYHFFCADCGSIIDLDMPKLDIGADLPNGLCATRHQLTFFGVCCNCQKEQCS